MMEDFWKQLHWYNIPELEAKPSSFDSNQILLRILLSVDYNIYEKGKPTFVYLYNMAIPELDSINHSQTAVDSLNKTGIDFYLYEPLSIRTLKQDSHFDNVVFAHSDIRADELDSILEYVQRNRLTNITVYVGDYEAEKYLSYYTPYMKLVVKDLHLLTIHPIDPKDESFSPNFSHKFINLNRRYASYRHILASYLSTRLTNLSWFYDTMLLTKTDWYDLTLWDQDILSRLEFNLPYMVLDVASSYDANLVAPELEKFYRDSFCDIVAESRFHRPMGNLSEKTLKPLYYKKPFVLAAPAKTLEYLKTLGFKTFSDFWDESYDECEDHEERIKKILTVIDFIDSMSLDELRIMYAKMVPILEHNFNRVNEIVFPYLHEYARRKGLLVK